MRHHADFYCCAEETEPEALERETFLSGPTCITSLCLAAWLMVNFVRLSCGLQPAFPSRLSLDRCWQSAYTEPNPRMLCSFYHNMVGAGPLWTLSRSSDQTTKKEGVSRPHQGVGLPSKNCAVVDKRFLEIFKHNKFFGTTSGRMRKENNTLLDYDARKSSSTLFLTVLDAILRGR